MAMTDEFVYTKSVPHSRKRAVTVGKVRTLRANRVTVPRRLGFDDTHHSNGTTAVGTPRRASVGSRSPSSGQTTCERIPYPAKPSIRFTSDRFAPYSSV